MRPQRSPSMSGAARFALLSLAGMLLAALWVPAIAIAQTPMSDAAGAWHVADQRELEIDGDPLSLSPDGQWIAGSGPDNAFCVWEVEGLDPECSADPYPLAPESIVWAPDSSAVAFSLDFARLLVESDIYVFDVETAEIANLTDDGVEDLSVEDLSDATEPILIDVFPAWSLDGSELTFARTDFSADVRSTTLLTVSRGGGEPAELLALDAEYPILINSPMRWLEDGSLLFTQWPPDLDDPAAGLWRLDPGDDPVRIVEGSEDDEYPIPIVTDVMEVDGRTVVLGFSPLLATTSTPDIDRSLGFALDLESGELEPLEEFVGIDNSGLEIGEQSRIFAPARAAPDGSALIVGIGGFGPGTLAIAEPGAGDPPAPLDIEPRFVPFAAIQGYAWASNDTVLIPRSEGPDLLITLERSAEATPAAPCSCTPPPRS